MYCAIKKVMLVRGILYKRHLICFRQGGVCMLNSEALFDMSQMDITRIKPETLVNISAVSIPSGLPHEQKVLSVMEQMGNPYCFLSGDIPVRVRFVQEGKTLSDSLIHYFSQLRYR